jgi:hypothetical protein
MCDVEFFSIFVAWNLDRMVTCHHYPRTDYTALDRLSTQRRSRARCSLGELEASARQHAWSATADAIDITGTLAIFVRSEGLVVIRSRAAHESVGRAPAQSTGA